MKFLLFSFGMFFFLGNAHAQDQGTLASILADSCKNSKFFLDGSAEYKTFCSGYIEAVIEVQQNRKEKDFYSCFPTYGDFDPYKKRVIRRFVDIYKRESKLNEYIRAYDLVNQAIDKEYKIDCAGK